jgi:hypothetical protein
MQAIFWHDSHSGIGDFVAATTSEINEKDFDVGVLLSARIKEGNGHFLLFRGVGGIGRSCSRC